jgi:hypothetical protein
MRQDHGDLVRSSEAALEVVIQVMKQVAKAIDGCLPADIDEAGAMRRAGHVFDASIQYVPIIFQIPGPE